MINDKPPLVRADRAGFCHICAKPFYVGDRIRIVKLSGNDVAEHPACWREGPKSK